ncbi:L-seryl-tRNA(Sec) selenium transferase [Actinomadura rupiterrae]|uniref:L-seryl-tRNA(Sec) selenium transferase n=1 Tax=Actinomadura rupiterrae TaxID=559627 RepID=UPI0020A5DED8|nr:L-seryl-tRNA(Sec) selenium transferase [Actinomadura rupiterrae]MCP2341445.1 L-seryl-tRNA(Sec) selenium transferase [Actinomadura rupiterrae]
MDPRPHTPFDDPSGSAAMRTGDPRRAVPRTDAVLADPALADAQGRLGRRLVKAAVTDAQERVRAGELAAEDLVAHVLATLPEHATTLRPVLNATGVLLHTNLGRAPLSAAARDALTAAAGCADVEYDLATGRRGPRGAGALAALRDACPPGTGVQIVNNNAAALALAATALAAGREIIVSRGELVEIGDGFRLPDLLTATGARLREVGTTNRTTLADYAEAIGPDTGFVLKVHPSNFTIEGFTYAPPVNDLAGLGVPLIVDIGSGLLAPHPAIPDEPDALTTLKDGAHLVTASADKLLGGPQAGLLLGDTDLLARLRRHPLYRALRVDKLTLAALEATLRGPVPPVRAMLDARPDDLRHRAEHLAAAVATPPRPGSNSPQRPPGSAPAQSVEAPAPAQPPAHAGPVEPPAPAQPVEAPAPAQPAKTSGPVRAGQPLAPAEPVEAPAPAQPAKTLGPAQVGQPLAPAGPVETPVPTQPPAHAGPVETPAPTQPPAHAGPVETPAPAESSGPARPQGEVGRDVPDGWDVRVVATSAVVGGGGAPGVTLPSYAVSLPAACEPVLRAAGVIGRLDHDRLLLDLRSVHPDDDETLHATVHAALTAPAAPFGPPAVPGPATEGN